MRPAPNACASALIDAFFPRPKLLPNDANDVFFLTAPPVAGVDDETDIATDPTLPSELSDAESHDGERGVARSPGVCACASKMGVGGGTAERGVVAAEDLGVVGSDGSYPEPILRCERGGERGVSGVGVVERDESRRKLNARGRTWCVCACTCVCD